MFSLSLGNLLLRYVFCVNYEIDLSFRAVLRFRIGLGSSSSLIYSIRICG